MELLAVGGLGGFRRKERSVDCTSMKQGLFEDERGVRSESELMSSWERSEVLL